METKSSEELYEIFKSEGIIKSPNTLCGVLNLIEGYLPGKIVSYDTEGIEDDRDYSKLFRSHARAFSNEYRISRQDCSSFYDCENQRAGITVEIGDHKLKAEWKQDSDWVQPEFYDFIKDKVEPLLSGKFVQLIELDQGYSGVYLPNEQANNLDLKLREFEKNLGNDDFG
jgi:hypothetical protein